MIVNQNRNEQVLFALRRITHAIDIHSRIIFLRHNLTGPQLFLIQEISKHSGVSPEELSNLVEIGVTVINDILDRLEKRGLVQRDAPVGQGLAPTLMVTEAGQDILRQTPPLLQEHFFMEFEKLNEWEQSLILSTLQRVATMLERGADQHGAAQPGSPDGEAASPVLLKGTA